MTASSVTPYHANSSALLTNIKNMKTLTFGSVCSGIEAASVAWEPLGWRAAWFAEIESFPSAVLAYRYPTVPNLGDMTKIAAAVRARQVSAPDILVGGTPCQAFSIAGLRGGLTDPRGQLTLSFVDLANAIDEQRPGDECVVCWENVPGVLSDASNAFGFFLAGLAGEDDALVSTGGKWANAGIVIGPKRAIAWRILDAQYFGVAQRRRRLFVVGSARKGFDPGKLLFELGSVRRDTAPSRKAREETAGRLASRTTGGCDVDHALAGHLRLECVSSAEGGGEIPFLTYPNLAKGVGNQTPLLTFSAHAQPDEMRFDEHVTAALTCSQQHAVAFAENSRGELRLEGGDRPPGTDVDTADSLLTVGMAVRRLTPRECERLQSFPDDWTLIPLPDRRGPPPRGDRRDGARMAADGPRYKALGNSMCVYNMRWLGVRLILSHYAMLAD